MRKSRQTSLSTTVKQEIIQYIHEQMQPAETKLPSEENFAELLGVSRITIRTALNDLENEGIVLRKQGKGTFVNRALTSMKVRFNPVSLFYDMIVASGYQPDVQLVDNKILAEPAEREIYQRLEIKEAEPLVLVSKIFYADGQPCVFCKDWFALSLLEDQEKLKHIADYPDSLFSFFSEVLKQHVTWDKTEIETTTNLQNDFLNEHFHCEQEAKAFLLLRSTNFNSNNQPVIYAEEYIDTNYIRFNSIRKKNRE